MGVSSEDFLQGGIEMMCRALVLARLGFEDRGSHSEKISWLEHELLEASGNLKQSLVTNTEYTEKLSREGAEREIVKGRAAELEWRVVEMAVKNARMKKVVEEADNKISVLYVKNSELKAEKGAVKTELDRNIDEILELLNQKNFQVVRQAHVLYSIIPSSGEFDPENEVFEGRILSRAEVRALESAAQPASTEGAEGEDQ